MKETKQSSKRRYNTFTFEVYPDSAPVNWIDILREQHVPMYISPPHDRDIDEHGDHKKTHHHIMVMFDTQKGLDACDSIIEAVNGVKPPTNIFVVANKRAYARYLLHLDDPAKFPYYKDSQVTAICGADNYDEFIKSKSQADFEEQQTMQEIQHYLEKYQIFNFAVACELARRTDNQEWFQCLKVNAYYFHSWCKAHNDPNWNAEHSKLEEILEKNYIKEEKL